MSDSTPLTKKSFDHLSFEDALKELETIVRALEGGKLSLDEAIRAYEHGSELKNYCEDKLKQAKLRIEKVMTAHTDATQTERPSTAGLTVISSDA